MRDAKARSFAETLLRDQRDAPANDETSDRERQPGAQATTLRVKYADNRRIEGFPWAHYTGYQWADSEDAKERLTLMFGARLLVVEGYRLRNLLREIDDGRRRHLVELGETEARLAAQTPEENEAVIASVKSYPDFEEILKEIKGDDREPGFAGKVRGR